MSTGIAFTVDAYSPFGAVLEGRKNASQNKYRFGYNTQESTGEIAGSRNHYTAQFWEYDPRVVTRWNIDPITYPWQSSYSINNNNPIVFTDPFGLFGSRKEAREYKKQHELKGRIKKGDDGIFSIHDKKAGVSYFRDHSLDGIRIAGRQKDGVIKAALISKDKPSKPSAGTYVDGLEEFGKRGGNLKVSTEPLKSTGRLKFYDNGWNGNQYIKTVNVFNKRLTKTIAKNAPVIGFILDAKEVADGIEADGNTVGANTAIEVAGVVGGAGGAWGGATLGAMIGTAIFPGVGTVVGGAIGAALGSWGGEELTETIMRNALNE